MFVSTAVFSRGLTMTQALTFSRTGKGGACTSVNASNEASVHAAYRKDQFS